MQIMQFLFHFLYVRNWHTGQLELSRSRLVLFLGMVFLVLLGVLIAWFLQSPVTYSK